MSEALPTFESTEAFPSTAPESSQDLPAFDDTEPTKEDKYSTTEQQVKTGLEGALSQALPFGWGTAAEVATGIASPTDIRNRREVNPGIHASGQAAGLALASKIPVIGPAMAALKVSGPVANLALHAAIAQSGDELSKMITEDPNQSVGSAVAHIGLSSLLGGGLGKLGSGASALWESKAAPKVEQMLQGIKGYLGEEGGQVSSQAAARGAKLVEKIVEQGLDKANFLTKEVSGKVFNTLGLPAWAGRLFGEKAIAPMMQSVLPALITPLARQIANPVAARAAVKYALAVTKGEALANKAAKGVFEGSIGALPGIISSSEDLTKLDDQAKDAQDNPEPLLRVGGELGHYLPAHTTALAEQASTVYGYLNGKRPKETKLSPMDMSHPPTEAALQSYQRTLQIAEQPLSILEHVKRGTLIPQDVQDLQAMYPGMHNKIGNMLTDSAMDFMSAGKQVPYKIRMGLSLFTGQPLDSTLTPQGIQSIQLTFLPKAPEQNGQKAILPASKDKSIAKSATQFQTPQQARETHRAKD